MRQAFCFRQPIGYTASMAWGAGKYDDVARELMKLAGAGTVAVVVLDGKHGPGVSAQFAMGEGETKALVAERMMVMVRALRELADAMQADARRLRRDERGN